MTQPNSSGSLHALSLFKDVIKHAVTGKSDDDCSKDCENCPCKAEGAAGSVSDTNKKDQCHE